ncbi:hypothetical protein D2N39_10295 [Gemmobacter lutimaris]|uniref:Uncharacterized protein n=1 Tax=Gemmobacter lutimaris TaxID=2306023 RepID=A0A398BWF9_9RHOB|nr:hypothetical protein [Gemmobacter lutimaris]RID91643.1 hypothetical protein D2N39_10295 [Gemmobacter lutimaris]
MSDLFKIRAAAKARSRERDEERLRRGEVTPSQLQQENLVFRGFRKGEIGLPAKYMKKIKKRSEDKDET